MNNNLTIVKGIPDNIKEIFGEETLDVITKLHQHFGGKMWIEYIGSRVPGIIMECSPIPSDDDFMRVLTSVYPASAGDEEWAWSYICGDGPDGLEHCTLYELED